jgi:hypothetical protein
MACTRSGAICKLFRELLHPANAVGSECWFPRYKRTCALTVTAILWAAFCGLQTPALGQTKASTSGLPSGNVRA